MATGIRPRWGSATAKISSLDPLYPIIELYDRQDKLRTSWAKQVAAHMRANMQAMQANDVLASNACQEYFVTTHMSLCILDDITFYALEGEVLDYEVVQAAVHIQNGDGYSMFKPHLCASTSDLGNPVISINGKRLIVLSKTFISEWREFKKKETGILTRAGMTAEQLQMTEGENGDAYDALRDELYELILKSIHNAASVDEAALYKSGDDIKMILNKAGFGRPFHLSAEEEKEEEQDYQELYKDNELYGMF